MQDNMTPDNFFDVVEESSPTLYSAPPPVWQKILRLADSRTLDDFVPEHSLKKARMSAMHVPEQLMKEARVFLGEGADVYNAYSLTEAGQTAVMKVDDKGLLPSSSEVSIKIIDDMGEEVERGKQGEISISGPHVAKSYVQPDAAPDAFINLNGQRFYRSGDIGTMDEHGIVNVVGRKKDVIMPASGVTIAPTEIEDVMRKHAAVSDVAVFPVKGKEGVGEHVTAAVVMNKSMDFDIRPSDRLKFAQALRDYTAKSLKPEKMPEGIVVVDAIPLDPVSQKVQRLNLADKLGLQEGFTDVAWKKSSQSRDLDGKRSFIEMAENNNNRSR